MYKMNWRDRFRTNNHRYAYTLLQQNTSLTFTYNIVHMVSTDKAKFFDRPEKLPERERPRSFVPLRSHVGSPEQSNIKRAKCIGHLHAPRRCFRIKLEWRVGKCEFFRSHHKEKSLPCVVFPWELFFKVCMSFPERKTMSNYISLFNSFMMLAIWPLLLGLVRSEAGRWTLPGIKWAQCLVASLITKATCYRTIDRFDELEISLEDIIFIYFYWSFIHFHNLASQVTACVAPNAVAPVQAVAQVDWADVGFFNRWWLVLTPDCFECLSVVSWRKCQRTLCSSAVLLYQCWWNMCDWFQATRHQVVQVRLTA